MYSTRRTEAEQYQLIMECRSSGLSDYQWCKQNGIRPNTFYNWVSRLRKKQCELPAPTSSDTRIATTTQDVVRLEITDESYSTIESEHVTIPETSAPITIYLRDASISLQNSVDPILLDRILRILGDQVC